MKPVNTWANLFETSKIKNCWQIVLLKSRNFLLNGLTKVCCDLKRNRLLGLLCVLFCQDVATRKGGLLGALFRPRHAIV